MEERAGERRSPSVLSPLLRRGERKKKSRSRKLARHSTTPGDAAGVQLCPTSVPTAPGCACVLPCGGIQFCKTVTTQVPRFRQTPDESLTSGDAEKQRLASNYIHPRLRASALKKELL
jgi:hypothetical protein